MNTNKEEIKSVAREFLLGELIKSATHKFRFLSTPFGKLQKSKQEELLLQIKQDISAAVIEAVEIIASDYRLTFRANCKQVAFTADGVKATLDMHNSEQAHALANAAGNTILVVIEDAQRYLSVGDAVEGQDEQQALL